MALTGAARQPARERQRLSWRRLLLLTGLFAVALNLRASVAAVGPVLGSITHSVHLSLTAAGLLTSIPVVCMGVFAPLGAKFGAWFGARRTILGSLLLVGLASALRLAGSSLIVLFVSTLLIGIGIAAAGTVVVTVVKQHFPDRAAFATGFYTVGIFGGSALATGLTDPISDAGGGWTVGLAAWAVLAALGVAIWSLAASVAERGIGGVTPSARPLRIPWRRGRAWLVMAFFGLQGLLFYVILAWLAPAYAGMGWSRTSSGLLLSGFLALQMVAALVIPTLADRFRDRRPWLALSAACYTAGLAGIALLPGSVPWLWVLALGSAGGLYPLALTLPVDYTANPHEASGWTALTLGGGYLIAAVGPFLAGALRDATGSYQTAFLLIAAVGLVELALTAWLGPQAPRTRGATMSCKATAR